MTAIAIATKQLQIPAELEQEILARIDRAGLHICEAELRYKLRWDERRDGSLLDVLDELERRGLIESALHFRLTEHGRDAAPRRLPAAAALRQRDPVAGAVMNADEARTHSAAHVELVGEIQRSGDRLAEIARRLAPELERGRNRSRGGRAVLDGAVRPNPEVGLWWVA